MPETRTFVFKNFGVTTLVGDISASATTITVENGAVLPSPGTGEIATIVLRDDAQNKLEIMNVTARSGNTLTVERGAENTTAFSWTNGVKVRNAATAEFFTKLATGSILLFRTSKLYPYDLQESIDSSGDVAPSFPTYAFLGDALDVSGSVIAGQLPTLLVSYTRYAAEAIDSSGIIVEGSLTTTASYKTYSNWGLTDANKEAIEASGSVISGVLDDALIDYTRYQTEAIDSSGSLVSGELE
jgi:hypothetical protein